MLAVPITSGHIRGGKRGNRRKNPRIAIRGRRVFGLNEQTARYSRS